MQDLPTAAELVEAVREFLEKDVFPALEGRTQFHTRVAMNVLGIVQRELEESAPRRRERTRPPRGAAPAKRCLRRLVAGAQWGAGRRRFATAHWPSSREELLAHLRETLRDKLAIANPKYLSNG